MRCESVRVLTVCLMAAVCVRCMSECVYLSSQRAESLQITSHNSRECLSIYSNQTGERERDRGKRFSARHTRVI